MKKTYDLPRTLTERLFKHMGWEWDEKYLGAKITPTKRRQTDSQRGYYWQALHAWGKHLGYTPGESEAFLHNAVLCAAYGVKETRRVRGSVIEIPNQRSSTATRDEYSDLIETLIYVAAESGYAIAPPIRGQAA